MESQRGLDPDRPSGLAVPPSRTEVAAGALAVLLLALRALDLARHFGSYLLLDDAFISFRYAANLASGLGLVFNPGERVEGFTNFFWTLLLAGGDRLGLDLPLLSILLASLATLGTVVLLILLGRQIFAGSAVAPWAVAVAPLLFAVIGCQARYVVAGMETPLFVFLVTLGAYLAVRGGSAVLTGAVFALAAMTRPEGVLYFALVWLFQPAGAPASAPARESVRWRLALGFLALAVPYFVWRYAYYGYLLPNTFYAKAGGGLSAALLQRGWAYLVSALHQETLEPALALSLLALVASPEQSPAQRRRRWLFASIVAAIMVYVVAVGGDFLFFFGPRFLMPALPFALLLGAEGLVAALRPIQGRARPALGALVLLLLSLYAARVSWPGPANTLTYVCRINQGWTELGRWLRANSAPGSVIAVGAVGRIPFYSGLYTIDTLGLTDTHIAHLEVPLGQGMAGHEKYDTGYVLSHRPDYMIFPLLDPAGRPTLAGWDKYGETIEDRYEMISLIKASGQPGPWILSTSRWTPELARQGYLGAVYRRRDLAAAPTPRSGSEPQEEGSR